MTLSDRYDGSTDAFEGDRTIVWRSLPSNATVTKATVKVTRAAAPGGILFEEVISFTNGTGDPGSTQNLGNGFAEVDFHKRRTLAYVDGTNVRGTSPTNGANLQVDLGGLYVEINNKGAILSPNDTAFIVPQDGTLPGRTIGKFKLTAAASPNVTSIRSVPTNVSVRVGNLAAFWTRLGELSTADSSPDCSTVLQTFLARATRENGFYVVPMVLHSDTVARLQVDQGIKEVVVAFDFDTTPKTQPGMLSVDLPPNARVLPGETAVKIIGAFNDTRIAHGVAPGTPPPTYAGGVSPSESQAQLVSPDKAVATSAVDVLVEAISTSAQLTLDLREDLNGKPSGVSVLPAPVNFEVNVNVDKQPHGVSVAFPLPFNFADGTVGAQKTGYRLVLQSIQGEAAWSTQPAPAGAVGVQHTLDGGLSWHYSGSLGASGPLDASFRLRNKPALFEVPLQLQVGSGDKPAPVSLDHYQPLARVDFTLDTSEFADAFNQYLATQVPAACPQGEHLVNGDFEQWVVTGNTVGTPSPIAASAAALAPAFNGRWTYVADPEGGIGIIDSVCDELLDGKILLSPGDRLLALALGPAGNRLYVVGESNLYVVDTLARLATGSSLPAATLAEFLTSPSGTSFGGHIAVSSDGVRIYLAFGNRIVSITTDVVEQVVRGRPLTQLDVTSAALSAIPAAMALSPDRSSLYVAVGSPATIVVIDPICLALEATRIQGISGRNAIHFTTDGKLALITTTTDNCIHVVDTANETIVDSLTLAASPQAVIASPDGSRAYALVSAPSTTGAVSGVPKGGSSLVPIDLTGLGAGPSIEPGVSGENMSITPQGDRIYVVSADQNQVIYVPVGARVPAEWFVTSDTPATPAQVFPACFPQWSPLDLVVIFGQRSGGQFQANPVAAGLSQVVPVAGPCSYEFSFWGLSDDADAVAEIFWLDQKASLLRTDTLPFEVVTETAKRNALVETSRKVQLQLQRASLTSPPGASQAEVRFTVPAFATVILGKTSLKGTAEILSDSDFRLLQNGVPAGWTLIPQAAPGISLSSSGGPISLLNSSTVDAELMQTIAIGENKQFGWQFQGRAVPVGTAQPGAQVELRFLKAGGAAAGPSMELKIVSDAFAKFPAAGTTPAGTAQVQIHLKAPSGTGLEIDEVSLQTPPTAPVPSTFVAQSPGELRVSKSLVTYDVVPVAPPPVPSTGIATPTAPGRKPGDPPCDAYGPCCQAEQPITQPSSKMTAAERPMMVGSCSTCGSPLKRPGGPLLNGAPVLHFPVLASHRLVPGPSCSSNHASAAAAHSRARDARRPCASISGSRHHVFRTTCGCVTRECRQGDEGTVAEKRSRVYRKRKNAHCVVEAFCYKAPERFWLGSALMDVYLKAR